MRLFFVALVISSAAFAQPPETMPPRELVDRPTAEVLPKGSFELSIRAYAYGGIHFGAEVGLLNRLQFGVSYGGTNMIGEDEVLWDDYPSAMVKYRLIDESFVLPGVAVGFDMLGDGYYDEGRRRFTFKSPGFFAVGSKSWLMWGGPLALHGGLNYSLEDDVEQSLDFFVGAEKNLNEEFSAGAEYLFALDDKEEDGVYGHGNGYFNVFARFVLADRLDVSLILKNLFDNREDAEPFTRELRITYAEFFK